LDGEAPRKMNANIAMGKNRRTIILRGRRKGYPMRVFHRTNGNSGVSTAQKAHESDFKDQDFAVLKKDESEC
jgi:hypothetical protein